mmetsp:Transcript_30463/g.55928  ORF Transcript_30463/g.55928 Transcript_30463/m.55928 type:complete len:93 (-) Transcript_30463:69-347(-)
MIVIGLLRLSDEMSSTNLSNFTTASVPTKLWNEWTRLDEASRRMKHQSTNSKKPTEHKVRDVDLVMLVFVGVEEARCRNALKASGNVKSALL